LFEGTYGNSKSSDTIKLKITGEIEISRQDFRQLFPKIQNPQDLDAAQFVDLREISTRI
jgi:hypothetical protein